MDTPFSQPKITYKVSFNTLYKYLEAFEKFFPEDILGISTFEVDSKTIEAADDDIWYIEAYFGQKLHRQSFTDNLQSFSVQNNLEIIGDINFATIQDKDWVSEYQKHLVPIRIGKFFITVLHQLTQCPPEAVPIVLEASRAFGTGDHPTTAGCLEAMEELSAFNFKEIYDIGTGSGILSFAAEKIWPQANVLACDIEEIAIEVAEINKQFNNSKVYFYRNSTADLMIPSIKNKRFDLIVSNILASPLIKLAPLICSLLNKRGRLIISGFLDYQADEVIDTYVKNDLKVQKVLDKKGWITILAKVKNN
ncbi:MAG: 50S ribosomal protein L11 methyltransferase [Rickettsiaceae bacterium]|nr:50S ribosomal protein L11 methyltransferase [Rickettsiaceae bacterium]